MERVLSPVRRNDPNNTRRVWLRFAVYAVLVGFHVVLLAQRLADSTILEPGVLAKYVAALLLLGGAYAYHRFAPAHLRGRRAQAVFWLIVLLLHAIAPAANAARDVVELIELTLLQVALVLVVSLASNDIARDLLHRVRTALELLPPAPARIPLPARAPPRVR